MSQLVLIVGMKETGKSWTLADLAQGLKRKTLIIDPGRAKVYSERGFEFIEREEIPAFSRTPDEELPGTQKIRRIAKVINIKRLIADIYGFDIESDQIYYGKAFVNGNLIMEDAKSYVNSSLTENLRMCIKGMKQYGLNLILSYHSISEISPEILDLVPDKVIFKKTGDRARVFSAIKKTESFSRYQAAMEAYYKAMVYGMEPKEIIESLRRHLTGIARDLQYGAVSTDQQRKKFAEHLSKMAHGRIKPTKAQRAMLRYQFFAADMRFKT